MTDQRPRAAAPLQPDLPAELEPIHLARLTHDTDLVEAEVADAQWADGWAAGVSMRAGALTAVDLSGSELERLRLLDARLTGCNLANLQAPRSNWVRVAVRGCRLTGVRLVEAFLRDVTFAECRIDLATFGSCRLQQVTFEDCRLSQSDFLESELQSVRFHDCDLAQADFRGVRMRRCELRGCELTGAHGIERLSGAAMPWPDIVAHAGTWAAALGIEVLDDH